MAKLNVQPQEDLYKLANCIVYCVGATSLDHLSKTERVSVYHAVKLLGSKLRGLDGFGFGATIWYKIEKWKGKFMQDAAIIGIFATLRGISGEESFL